MYTDLNRLHAVLAGDITYRGCGKTFAKCHDVLGAIELGHININCVVTVYADISYILPMLDIVARDHNLYLYGDNKEWRIGQAKLRFFPEDDLLHKTRGIRGFIVYMRQWD